MSEAVMSVLQSRLALEPSAWPDWHGFVASCWCTLLSHLDVDNASESSELLPIFFGRLLPAARNQAGIHAADTWRDCSCFLQLVSSQA